MASHYFDLTFIVFMFCVARLRTVLSIIIRTSVRYLIVCFFNQTYRLVDQALTQGVNVAVCSTSNEKAVCIITNHILEFQFNIALWL